MEARPLPPDETLKSRSGAMPTNRDTPNLERDYETAFDRAVVGVQRD